MEAFISNDILMTYDSEDSHQIRLKTIPKIVCWNPALTWKFNEHYHNIQFKHKTGCTYKTGSVNAYTLLYHGDIGMSQFKI